MPKTTEAVVQSAVVSTAPTLNLFNADVLDVLALLPDNHFDAVLSDPPYGLSTHTQADINNALTAWVSGKPYTHKAKGFMGNTWDSFVPGPEVWKEVLRVLKPGGFALIFAGSRTQDLMGMSLRLAGFELRDSILYVAGSGFPKSHNISKALDKAAGAEREVIGINEDYLRRKPNGMKTEGANSYGYSRSQHETDARITAPATPLAERWEGFGTALKPAYEPALLVRKPSPDTFADIAKTEGCGALNIDGCRVGTSGARNNGNSKGTVGSNSIGTYGKAIKQDYGMGRFPANLVLDGSQEVADLFPEAAGQLATTRADGVAMNNKIYGALNHGTVAHPPRDDGDNKSASRFFKACEPSELDDSASYEPALLVRKPSPDTFANIAKNQGCGALNIDACRVGVGAKKWETPRGGIWATDADAKAALVNNPLGRFPANLVLDGSQEIEALFPESAGAGKSLPNVKVTGYGSNIGKGTQEYFGGPRKPFNAGTGSAARFFKVCEPSALDKAPPLYYCAKPGTKERNAGLGDSAPKANVHPTVKPVKLAQYLATLLLPPVRVEGEEPRRILVPFSGSGSECVGAGLAGWDEITGIEISAEYAAISAARFKHWTKGECDQLSFEEMEAA